MRIALFLALVVPAVGCGSRPCPIYPHTDGLRALRQYASARIGLRSIRAEARVDQRGRQGRIRGTVYLFAERPDRVRLDAMTQFGPAAILTSNGGRFAYTDLRKNRFYEGTTCPANIERLLGLRLSVEETTSFLLGQPPVIVGDRASIGCTRDGYYRVELRAADGRRQQIDISVRESDLNAPPERQRLRLARSELYDRDGRTIWRATFSDYRVLAFSGSGVAMPFEVSVQQPAAGSDTLVRFQSMEANPEIPPSAFFQTARPGLSIEETPCE